MRLACFLPALIFVLINLNQKEKKGSEILFEGDGKKTAPRWDRTTDLSVNSRALYLLSYRSIVEYLVPYIHFNSLDAHNRSLVSTNFEGELSKWQMNAHANNF